MSRSDGGRPASLLRAAWLVVALLSVAAGPSRAQTGPATTQVMSDVTSLEADRAAVDLPVLERSLDEFARAEGFAAPEAARRSPMWHFSHVYLGPNTSVIGMNLSSDHVFLSMSRLLSDATDYSSLARRLAARFAPFGFHPSVD